MTKVRVPFIKPRYPGLRSGESELLRGYLREQGLDRVTDLWTNQRMGQGEVLPNLEEPYRSAGEDLSKYRADAVIRYPGSWEVVELKSRAEHHGAGQLIAYSNLLSEEDPFPTSWKLTIVAFREHPDLRDGLRGTGIRVHTLPHLDPTSASR